MRRLCSLHALCPVTDLPELPASSERRRVLVVESDPALRKLLIEGLSRHYEVEAASDGLAAWHSAQYFPPDLVIIDLYAPGTDSLILTRCLRAGVRMAALPIILLTASVDRALMLRCLTAGASNFLLKPFGMVELLAFVRVELDLHGAPAGSRR